MKKKIFLVAGARPNFMKIAPLMRQFKKGKDKFQVLLVHTGQHYDYEMSKIFFKNLHIPDPDIYLQIGSASHALQTAKIMIAFEKVVLKEKPDLIMVVGDVNSTLACSLVAAKLNIKVAHVEAGLRSFDLRMPEEVNRMLTDKLSDYLFVSEESGVKNIKDEGISAKKVHFVGNVMIDTLLYYMNAIEKSTILEEKNLISKKYCVMTLHRPGNVDCKKTLAQIYAILKEVTKSIAIVYPLHPRTKKMIKKHTFLKKFNALKNLSMIAPLGYINFIKLVKESHFVITDSGGIQEETAVLNIPCLTIRENTERPITLTNGTNYLVGRNREQIIKKIKLILSGKAKKSKHLNLWDGMTAKRIVKIIEQTI
ncbi:MAG: UDP-N-acetylglucosamine 2-epimerase (non-hydrolyzing) [Candidatus Omnitrophota bacterium]|nr:MAG: UDP-N-acetylglucosamine 2-epimerase (non-hydrolyzing) [Candidatus Omnitrophota bacterium]